MKRIQHIFMKYKRRYGHPPTSLSDLVGVPLSSEERKYAQKLLQGIRQRMSRRNPIKKEHQVKLLTLINNDNLDTTVQGLSLLEQLADDPQDIYDVLNQGQPIKHHWFGLFPTKNKSYIQLFTLGLLAGMGVPWALSQTIIDFSHRKLGRVPQNIGNLVNTKLLYLSGNELDSLPNSMSNLVNLEKLWLSFNNFTDLPTWFNQFKNLEVLSLSGNNLTKLPQSIVNLPNLEELMIEDNNLRTLPNSISNLKNLKMLELSGNEITHLPDSLGQVENLERLYLKDNEFLNEMPESIGDLDCLRLLHLQRTNVKNLPDKLLYNACFGQLGWHHPKAVPLPRIISHWEKDKYMHNVYLPIR